MEQFMQAVEEAEEAAEKAQSAWVCQVCLTNSIDTALIPCGHTVCSNCARHLQQGRCPFCRNVGRPLRIYQAS